MTCAMFGSKNFTVKVRVLQTAGIECDVVVSRLPELARDSLLLLGVAHSRIHDIDRPARFRAAYYLTPISARSAQPVEDVSVAQSRP